MTYSTSQRKLLQNLFKAHPNRAFTVKEITDALAGSEISVSAVYRNLSSMVKDGQILRSVNKTSREAIYQAVGCHDNCTKIHLTCTECGTTLHIDQKTADLVQTSVDLSDGFMIDNAKTVLYGTCRSCRKK